jgi:glutamyl/glutaminyl-tRNA synthetase
VLKTSSIYVCSGVEQYEALGYLPEAMRNYLSRLSWAHGNDEIFSTEQATYSTLPCLLKALLNYLMLC